MIRDAKLCGFVIVIEDNTERSGIVTLEEYMHRRLGRYLPHVEVSVDIDSELWLSQPGKDKITEIIDDILYKFWSEHSIKWDVSIKKCDVSVITRDEQLHILVMVV
jgi:hypothetical protein